MEKYNIPDPNSLNSMEGVELPSNIKIDSLKNTQSIKSKMKFEGSSDFRNSLYERCPYYFEKDFNTWSLEEKEVFHCWCIHFNNLFAKIEDALRCSEKNTLSTETQSKNQFYEDIIKALLNSGVDLDELREVINLKNSIADEIKGLIREKDFDAIENMGKKRTNIICEYFIKVLPSIFYLLDNGYTFNKLRM